MEAGDGDFPPEGLLRPILEPGLRDLLGKIHPNFMGGEYLPDYLPEEVEIARVARNSTTGDVISIRANLEENGLLHYRVVDEYAREFRLPHEVSDLPLSTSQMIQLIDGAEWDDTGLILPFLEVNCEYDDAERLRDFIWVSSDFYPALAGHYRRVSDAFLDSRVRPAEEEGE